MAGAVGPRTAGTVRDGMEYEEGGDAFCRAGREGLQKLPPLTLKRPLGGHGDGSRPAGRDKPNHAVSY